MTTPNQEPIPAVSNPTLQVLKVEQIHINPDRDYRGEDVDLRDLLASIPAVGLLHPLLVQPERDGKYELLAGHRRLRALRKLGCIDVHVEILDYAGMQADLVTLDENLARQSLPPSQEGKLLARQKEIYESLHPEARHGGARSGTSGPEGQLKQPSFAERAARATGQSARTIRKKVKVAESATPQVQAALDDGKLSLNDAESLSALPVREQVAHLDAMKPVTASTEPSAKALAVPPRFSPSVNRMTWGAEELLHTIRGLRRPLPAESAEALTTALLRMRTLLDALVAAVAKKTQSSCPASEAVRKSPDEM